MAGGRHSGAAAATEEAESQATKRARTNSSERRGRLQPGWMRRSMVAMESTSPEGCMRWKPPEDSPEAPRNLEESEKINGFQRMHRESSPGCIASLLPTRRVVPVLEPFAKTISSPKTWQDESSASSPRPVIAEPQQPPLLRSRRSTGDLAPPRRRSPPRSVHLQPGPVPFIERLAPALASARSSSSSALYSARGINSAREGVISAPRRSDVLVSSTPPEPRCGEFCSNGAEQDPDPINNDDLRKDREIRLVTERLEAAERERNWAVVALRESECSLQAALASAAQSKQQLREMKEGHMPRERDLHSKACQTDDPRLQYSNVLIEMLSVRCRGLEERLDYEAMEAVMRDAESRKAFSALEDQAARLGAALVEQQRSSRAREDALRELTEQHNLEIERLRREVGNEDMGLNSSRSGASWKGSTGAVSKTSENVHLAECWDNAARQTGAPIVPSVPSRKEVSTVTSTTGEPCWRLQTDVPGLLSAGLPKVAATNGLGDQVSNSDSRNSPRQQRTSPSNSPRAVSHQRSESRPPQGEVAIVTLQEMPASPQFGKFAADESSPSSPRSPQMVCPPRTSNTAVPTITSTSRPQIALREVSPPPANCSNAAESRIGAETHMSNNGEDADAQLEDLHTSLAATTDLKQAARLWARIGTLQQRRKCFNEARQAYAAAVHLDGGAQHGSLANLAQLEAHAGNVSLARDLLERAVAIDPTNSAYRAFRQWLLKESGISEQNQT